MLQEEPDGLIEDRRLTIRLHIGREASEAGGRQLTPCRTAGDF
ncbi:hypothetical protein HMPREF9141_0216 [Prevotella multiformis DSM 16608]|uniref:Uncharacterized protein n=1 Tax=Prevotella multiformis DSM 16608 TaxID=888743 RepID=F0F3Q0_9BACT|nr:hypothetical protein HMPREF9141_0216 [Prevotella multiformis DSM 16608]